MVCACAGGYKPATSEGLLSYEPCDVLPELTSRELTLEEIEALYDATMESDHSVAVEELLGISQPEWTAFGHGVGFEELARWRVDGWPTLCPLCGKHIAPCVFGWLAQEEAGLPSLQLTVFMRQV